MAWIEVDVRRCFELKWSVITCICIVSAMCEDVTQQRQGTERGPALLISCWLTFRERIDPSGRLKLTGCHAGAVPAKESLVFPPEVPHRERIPTHHSTTSRTLTLPPGSPQRWCCHLF